MTRTVTVAATAGATTPACTYTVLIPARLASTRLPDKPLADIGGIPMVVRVARQARQSGATRTVVAADDARIVEACRQHGIEALMTRPDHANGSDRLAEACDLLGLPDDAIVVNVQGDEPLMPPALIASVAQLLHERPQADIATAAHPIHSLDDYRNPNVVKVVCDRSGLALYFSRAPIAWQRDGSQPGAPVLPSPAPLRHVGIYAYRVGFLRTFPHLEQAPLEITEALEQLRALWHGRRIAVFVTDEAPGGGVDTPEDLARVRALLA